MRAEGCLTNPSDLLYLGVESSGVNGAPCPGTMRPATFSTLTLPGCMAAASQASGSSTGSVAVHHRCVKAVTPSGVPTRVVMHCGVCPGVSIRRIDGETAKPSAGREVQVSFL